jgi:hypothetical protein
VSEGGFLTLDRPPFAGVAIIIQWLWSFSAVSR